MNRTKELERQNDFNFEIKNLNEVINRLFWQLDMMNKRCDKLEQILLKMEEK